MKDFWEKLDEAFAHIFKTKKKDEDIDNERRLPRKKERTRTQ